MDIQDQLELNSLFEGLQPMASKKAAVCIGRFNPATKGHYAIINLVKKFIREKADLGLEASPIVVIIGGGKSDADRKRNPLTVHEREAFMKASGSADGVRFMTATNAFEAFSLVRAEGFEPIAIAAGSDRVHDYIRILDGYFKTPSGDAIKHYKIDLARDAAAVSDDDETKQKAMDSTLASMKDGSELDIDEVSGSLARRAVELGYEAEFAEIVGMKAKPTLAKKMFNKIKAALAE